MPEIGYEHLTGERKNQQEIILLILHFILYRRGIVKNNEMFKGTSFQNFVRLYRE